jgi:hypothetical protein
MLFLVCPLTASHSSAADRVLENDLGTGGMSLDGFNNPAGFYTMTFYVAVPKTGDLWLSHGNPSKVHFHRYPLEEAGR